MDYKTLDVRVACEVVKECLVDEEAKKVVLVAHSQGGIIASMIVDALFMELSESQMGKLVRLLPSQSYLSYHRILFWHTDSGPTGNLHLWLCSIPFSQPPGQFS